MAEGQKAALCSMSEVYNVVGIYNKNIKYFVFVDKNGKIITETLIKTKTVYLKIVLDLISNNNKFFYSLDNKTYLPLGDSFEVKEDHWKGIRIV